MWMKNDSIRQFYQDAKNKESAITYLAKTNECDVSKIKRIISVSDELIEQTVKESEVIMESNEENGGNEIMKGNSNLDNDKIQHLYDDGMSDAEIARTVEVHHMTILSWRKRNGLPANGETVKKDKPSKKKNLANEQNNDILSVLRPLLAMCSPGDSDNVKAGFRVLASALLEQELDRAFGYVMSIKDGASI